MDQRENPSEKKTEDKQRYNLYLPWGQMLGPVFTKLLKRDSGASTSAPTQCYGSTPGYVSKHVYPQVTSKHELHTGHTIFKTPRHAGPVFPRVPKGFQPGSAEFRLGPAEFRPDRAEFRPGRAEFRPRRAEFRPSRAEFRPSPAEFRPPGDPCFPPGQRVSPSFPCLDDLLFGFHTSRMIRDHSVSYRMTHNHSASFHVIHIIFMLMHHLGSFGRIRIHFRII